MIDTQYEIESMPSIDQANDLLTKKQNEFLRESSGVELSTPLAKVLIDLCSPVSDRRAKSKALRLALDLNGVNVRIPSFKILKKAHDLISKSFKKKLGIKHTATYSEQKFLTAFEHVSDMKIIQQQLIGPYVVDFFLPKLKLNPLDNIKSMNDLLLSSMSNCVVKPNYAGIVIEIDGGIHNEETKMRRDIRRDEFLVGLNLKVYRLDNNKVFKNLEIQSFIMNMLRQHSIADNKSIQNQMSRIYLSTIAFLGQDELFIKLFGVSKTTLKEYELRYRNFDKSKDVVYE
jgi:very-short-patch-repair endonuclease